MDLTELIEAFFAAKQRTFASNTRRAYRYDLMACAQVLPSRIWCLPIPPPSWKPSPKERVITLIDASHSVALLRKLLKTVGGVGPLFRGDVHKGGRYGEALDYSTIWYHFERYVEQEPITIHRLRHTYATVKLRSGVSLPSVRKLLGHKNLQTTLRYTEIPEIQGPAHGTTPRPVIGSRKADWSGERVALFPELSPCRNVRRQGASGAPVGAASEQFFLRKEEDVFGLFDHPCCRKTAADFKQDAAEDGPAHLQIEHEVFPGNHVRLRTAENGFEDRSPARVERHCDFTRYGLSLSRCLLDDLAWIADHP
jgi:hypothetical protein